MDDPRSPGRGSPDDTSEPSRPGEGSALTRRSFVVRALAAIGGVLAAAVALPSAIFVTAPGWRARTPLRWLSLSVSPTLRTNDWTTIGKLTDFEVGVPQYRILQREVVDGWVREKAPVGIHVVRETETDVAVMDPHCTHLGCPLSWSAGAERFLCPCHGGAFDATGQVVAGPPPRPMARYDTRIQDGEIQIASLREGA